MNSGPTLVIASMISCLETMKSSFLETWKPSNLAQYSFNASSPFSRTLLMISLTALLTSSDISVFLV